MLSLFAKEIFGALRDIYLFTLKLRMLHHIAEHLERFGDVRYLDAFLSEHSSFATESVSKMPFLKKRRTYEEAVLPMNASQDFRPRKFCKLLKNAQLG